MLKTSHRIAPYIAISLAVVFWGLSFVATKIALESLTLFTLLSMRFLTASGIFLALMALRGVSRLMRYRHHLRPIKVGQERVHDFRSIDGQVRTGGNQFYKT